MAKLWCVDSETSESSVVTKIPISGVLGYGHSHCDIIVLRLLFACFKFWDGILYFVPNMWQVVFANVSIQGRVVYSNI